MATLSAVTNLGVFLEDSFCNLTGRGLPCDAGLNSTPRTSWDHTSGHNGTPEAILAGGKLDEEGGIAFPPLKQSILMIWIYSLAYSAVFCVGILGNSLVVAIVIRNPRMHDVTNYFIVNLAVADILVCLFCLPITLLQNLFSGWIFGAVMCKVTPFLQGVSVCASVNTLMAIALERYLAICHTLKFRLTSKVSRLVLVLIWVFSLTALTPWAIYYRHERLTIDDPSSPHHPVQYICDQRWPTPDMARIYFLIALFVTCYTIPLICISVCYALIGYRVCNRYTSGALRHQSSSAVINKSKVKVVKMLVVVVIVFAFSWLPLYVVNLRIFFGPPVEVNSPEFMWLTRVIIPVIQWSGSANSCVNPIIYCFFSEKFREGFRQLVLCREPCCGRPSGSRLVRKNSGASSEYDRSIRSRPITQIFSGPLSIPNSTNIAAGVNGNGFGGSAFHSGHEARDDVMENSTQL